MPSIRALALIPAAVGLCACFDPSGAPMGSEPGDDAATETAGVDDHTADETGGPTAGGTDPGQTSANPDDGGETGDPTQTGGPADDGDPTGGDDDSGSDDGGPEACADGQGLCLAAPAGWSGPGALDDHGAGAAPDCGGAQVLLTADGAFSAPAATCGCECGDAVGASCPDARIIAYGDDSSCGAAEEFSQVIEEVPHPSDPCNFISTDAPLSDAGYWTLETISEGGSCTENPTVDIPEAGFGTAVSTCAMEPLEMACDGDAQCFADPEVPMCIWQDGEHACPGGDFTEQTIYYRGGISDTRSCTECVCGDPEGSCPTSVADVFIGHYCNGTPVDVEETCDQFCFGTGCETYGISAELYIGPSTAECAPTGGNLTGSATPQDPVTLCCTG